MGNQNFVSKSNVPIIEKTISVRKNKFAIDYESEEIFEKARAPNKGLKDDNDNENLDYKNLPNKKTNFLKAYRRINGLCAKHLLNPHAYKLSKFFD